MALKSVKIEDMKLNPFTTIGKEWMLITAGDEKHNTMTASWGGLGVLWGKNVATVYIRESRYTIEFVEDSDYFSLCVFDEMYRDALNFCGTKSGRDFDKDKEANLTALYDQKAPYYAEAKLVFICKKLYHQNMTEDSFIDKSILDDVYPDRDLHRVFVGEIVEVLEKV